MSADFDFGDLALPDSNDLTAPVLGAQDTSLTDGDWRANNPMVNDTGESPDTALTPMPETPPEMIPGTNIPSHGIPEQGWGPEGKTGKSFDGETNDYMEIIPKNNKDRIWFPPPEHDEFDEHAPRKEWEA